VIQNAVVSIPDGDGAWYLERVAGLPLVERSLIDLRLAGVEHAHLCGGPSVRASLAEHFSARAGDRRLPRIHLHDRPGAAAVPGPVLWLDGTRVYHQALLQDAAAQGAETTYRTPGGEPAGVSVVSPSALGRAALPGWSKTAPLPDGTFSHPAQSRRDRRKAERLIFKSLAKPVDGLVSRHLNRPISTRISRILARLPVHPNLISILALVVAGVPSGLFSALGTYPGLAIGGLLFQLNSILDGVDGEIARVKHLSSRRGEWLDSVCDTLSNLVYLSGVTVGVHRALGSDLLLWSGIAAVVLNTLAVAAMFWHLATRFGSGSKLDYRWDIQRPEARRRPLNRLLLWLQPLTRQDAYSLFFMLLALAGAAWVILPAAMISFGVILAVICTQFRTNG
jgi:phosphatidylglycerophosphate synthase